MRLQTRILLALLIFAPSISAHARQASTSQTSVVDRVLSDEAFTKGIDALHNLDFEEARRRFEEVTERFPDHPAGPYYLASSLFLRTLTKPSRLLPLLSNLAGSETFSGSAEDKVDPDTVQHFRDLTRQAKVLAKARLQRDSRDTVA